MPEKKTTVSHTNPTLNKNRVLDTKPVFACAGKASFTRFRQPSKPPSFLSQPTQALSCKRNMLLLGMEEEKAVGDYKRLCSTYSVSLIQLLVW